MSASGGSETGPRIGDAALRHLRMVVDEPDLGGTRYEIGEPLGRGGMGAVWRAHDRQLERDVALKVLLEPAAPESARRLVEEAKVLARLEHPGIVPVHDAGILADGRVYYAMKLVRGRRLDEIVRGGGAEAERFRTFARICEAVAFAHARGVVHRDLKPQNVMVGEFGEVLVLDWGLAAARDSVAGARAGTPGFMAPEQQHAGTAADTRADIYSLGRVLATLGLEGKALAAIADKASAADPVQRYGSALELAADVARFQAGEAVSAVAEGLLVKLGRWYRKYRVAVWLVASYAVLRIGFEVVRGTLGR